MNCYRAGNAKSSSPLLTSVSRPGKTVSLATGPANLAACWTQKTESSREGLGAQCLGFSIERGSPERCGTGSEADPRLFHQRCWEELLLTWNFLEKLIYIS